MPGEVPGMENDVLRCSDPSDSRGIRGAANSEGYATASGLPPMLFRWTVRWGKAGRRRAALSTTRGASAKASDVGPSLVDRCRILVRMFGVPGSTALSVEALCRRTGLRNTGAWEPFPSTSENDSLSCQLLVLVVLESEVSVSSLSPTLTPKASSKSPYANGTQHIGHSSRRLHSHSTAHSTHIPCPHGPATSGRSSSRHTKQASGTDSAFFDGGDIKPLGWPCPSPSSGGTVFDTSGLSVKLSGSVSRGAPAAVQ